MGDALQNPFVVTAGLQKCPCAEKAKHMVEFSENFKTLEGISLGYNI